LNLFLDFHAGHPSAIFCNLFSREIEHPEMVIALNLEGKLTGCTALPFVYSPEDRLYRYPDLSGVFAAILLYLLGTIGCTDG
jgi:hypothetical protein